MEEKTFNEKVNSKILEVLEEEGILSTLGRVTYLKIVAKVGELTTIDTQIVVA